VIIRVGWASMRRALLEPKKEKAVFKPTTPETFVKEIGCPSKRAYPLKLKKMWEPKEKKSGHYFVNGFLIAVP
jgi:hypothetical protein